MIQLTEAAAKFLLRVLEENEESAQEQACFRVTDGTEGDFELVLDTPTESDLKLKHDDRTVIAVDAKTVSRCQDLTLDIVDEGDGSPQFVFVETPRRPGAEHSDD